MAELINQGLFLGTLDDIVGVDVATTIVTTRLIDGLIATKRADKEVWVNGELTYTIVLKNESGENFTDLTFTDELDITKIDLLSNSVYINGTLTPYTYSTGILRINLANLPDGEEMTIEFKVIRI